MIPYEQTQEDREKGKLWERESDFNKGSWQRFTLFTKTKVLVNKVGNGLCYFKLSVSRLFYFIFVSILYLINLHGNGAAEHSSDRVQGPYNVPPASVLDTSWFLIYNNMCDALSK